MKKILYMMIGAISGMVLGFMLGLLLGAFIGGNFMMDFEFNGVRGYEAVGQIGAFLGAFFGAGSGGALALRLFRKRLERSRK